MGDPGTVRFPGNLDPRAQEFRPMTIPNHTFQQISLFGPPPLPPVLPPPQICFPYPPQPPPFVNGGIIPYPQYHSSPTAYVSSVPPLPPHSPVPTRTLVLSSVPSDVSESVIRRELEIFGEVRGVQMERVWEGIVTVHFYNLRHAEKALKEIRERHMQQQSRLRGVYVAVERNSGGGGGGVESLLATLPSPAPGLIAGCAVWAQFIIPSCTAVPDGYNQGTIVVFNLDPNVSTSRLKEIFQAFGLVKELRETPLKRQQRFVEFYDVRDAAKALREMNGKEINGKQVVIEFSRPGGYSKKFFNASSASKNLSTNTTIINFPNDRHHHTTNSKRAPQQPPSPPPPPSFLGRFSPSNVPPRSLLVQRKSASARKLILSSCQRNPNDQCTSKKAMEASVRSLSLSDGAEDGTFEKRNSKKGHSIQSNGCGKQQQQHRSTKPWKGKQAKKLETRFLIHEDVIAETSCSDSRTTVMIKNIPNKYSQKLLLNMLDSHCIDCNKHIEDGDEQALSSYDFVYLPIDFNNKCNVGYGFVNMTSPQAACRLYKAFHHQRWEVFNSRKICEVTYARVQGLEALKEHFKNSKFPSEMDHYLPVVFTPPRDGKRLTEPLPIVGHNQQPPTNNIILGLPIESTDRETDGGDSLKNSNDDTEPEEEENLINCSEECSSSSPNGGDMGDDDQVSSGSIVA